VSNGHCFSPRPALCRPRKRSRVRGGFFCSFLCNPLGALSNSSDRLGGRQRGARNVTPPCGQRTGTGQIVRRHQCRTNVSMIKQKKMLTAKRARRPPRAGRIKESPSPSSAGRRIPIVSAKGGLMGGGPHSGLGVGSSRPEEFRAQSTTLVSRCQLQISDGRRTRRRRRRCVQRTETVSLHSRSGRRELEGKWRGGWWTARESSLSGRERISTVPESCSYRPGYFLNSKYTEHV